MRRILVVVDYQVDFVNGALGFKGAELLDDKISNRIMEYLRNDDIVVFTFDTHDKNYLNTREGMQLPVPHCIKGSDGWKLYGKTSVIYEHYKNHENVVAIEKATFGVSPYSFVGNSKLNQLIGLHEDISTIELCGLVTNMCVVSNAVTFQARFPNAQIFVNANMVDSFSKELHNKTLDVLEGMQVKVLR